MLGSASSSTSKGKGGSDWSWLVDPHPKGLREARNLSRRVASVEKDTKQLVQLAWDRFIQWNGQELVKGRSIDVSSCIKAFKKPPTTQQYSSELKQEAQEISLATILELSADLDTLKGNLGRLRDRICTEFFPSDSAAPTRRPNHVSSPDQVSPPDLVHANADLDSMLVVEMQSQNDSDIFVWALADAPRNADDKLRCAEELVRLVLFLNQSALCASLHSTSPSSSSSSAVKAATASFRSAMVKALVPALIRLLQDALPTSLDARDFNQNVNAARRVGERAKTLHRSLVESGLASNDQGSSGADEEEEQENNWRTSRDPSALLSFAKRAAAVYFHSSLALKLSQVRKELTEEDERSTGKGSAAGTGWSNTCRVELRHHLGGGPLPPAMQGQAEEWKPFVDAEEHTPSPQVEFPPQLPQYSTASTHQHQHFPQRTVSSSRSNTPDTAGGHGSSGIQTPPGSNGGIKKPRGKAALGAARIVKAKDQLGSGPWDVDGSGLDDPDRIKLASSSSRSAALAPPPDDAESAWDLDEDVVLPALAPPTHASPAAKVLPVDDDDLWFADEPQQSSITAPSAAASISEDDIPIDDDAWGLSAEQIAKRASMRGIPSGFSTSSIQPQAKGPAKTLNSPPPAAPAAPPPHEESARHHLASSFTAAPAAALPPADEEIDDDAWGLSDAEIAARRASRIPASFSLSSLAEATKADLAQQPGMDHKTVPAEAELAAPETRQRTSSEEKILPPPTAAASVPKPMAIPAPADDDLDDDAWGLSDEEIAARRSSRIGVPAGFSLSSIVDTSAASHEQKEVAAAPVKLEHDPVKSVQDTPHVPSLASEETTEDEQAAEQSTVEELALKEPALEEPAVKQLAPEKSAATHFVPPPDATTRHVATHTLLPPTDIDRDAEDAWGLSEAELAARQASRMGAATEPSQDDLIEKHDSQASSSMNHISEPRVAGLASLEDTHAETELVRSLSPDAPLHTHPIATAVPPILQRAAQAIPAMLAPAVGAPIPRLGSDSLDKEDEEDWGFSPGLESAPTAAQMLTPKVDSARELPQEEGTAHSRSPAPLRTQTPPSASLQPSDGGDGWGLSPQPSPTVPTHMPTPALSLSQPSDHGLKQAQGDDHAGEDEDDDDNEAWGWDEDKQAAATPGPEAMPSVIAEQCSVSVRTLNLLDRVGSLLDLIDTAEDVLAAEHGVKASEAIVATILDAIDLHTGIMPAVHADVLLSVPSLAVQFANDCSYISQQLQHLIDTKSQKYEQLRKGFESRAALTNLVGKQCFEAQLVRSQWFWPIRT